MSRSSDRGRGQVEPLVALAGVLAVCVGLSVYAGAVDGFLVALDAGPDAGAVAEQAADRVASEARVDGSLRPGRLDEATTAGPEGFRLNATLRVRGKRWTAGPPWPARASTGVRRGSVRVAPGRVRPGVLRVRVWR